MHFEGGRSHLGVAGPKRQKLDATGGGDKGCKPSLGYHGHLLTVCLIQCIAQ